MALAMAWVSRITTVAFEMVLPGLAGLWLDNTLGTVILFTLAGFGLGLTLAIWHLMKMTAADAAASGGNGKSQNSADR
jgi:hypothetical protein